MSEHIMGIEIGSSNIKIIEVSRKAAMYNVHKFSMIETPADSVNNGVIIDTEAVRKVIAQELSMKKYRAKKVVGVLQSSNIIIRNVVMDKQTDKVIKDILDIKLEEYMPIDRAQYQVDYKVLRSFEEEEKEKIEVSLVAAPNSLVLPFASLMKTLKLTPILINIASEAVANAFGGNRRIVYEASENLLVLDIGGRSSHATIVSNGQAVLNRYIDFGVQNINEAIKDREQNRSILEKESDEQDVFEIVRPLIEYNIISEVERILQFYYSNFNTGVIKKVFLIGGGASIKGLRSYIRDTLNIPTEKLKELNTVSEEKGVEFENYRRFFVNILGTICGL